MLFHWTHELGVCFSHSCQVLFAAGVCEGSFLWCLSIYLDIYHRVWLVFLAAGVSLEVLNNSATAAQVFVALILDGWFVLGRCFAYLFVICCGGASRGSLVCCKGASCRSLVCCRHMEHKSLLVTPSAPPRGFVPEEVFDKHGNLVKQYDEKGRINANWQRLVNCQKLKEEAAQLVLC